jgi:hypothetical protein
MRYANFAPLWEKRLMSPTSFSTGNLFRILLLPAALALSTASSAPAQVYLTLDGRDAANLAGDGNHAPFHNPPNNFAFTFGGVSADNPDAGPGDPPTATETNFNFTGSDYGGLGFGTASAGDLAFPMPAMFQMDVTVNRGNTLSHLMLNLKDADTLSPVQVHLIEEHQYQLPLGGAGTKTITALLSFPWFTNTPRDGIPNFDPDNGLTELQLQYPFSAGGSGDILNITIHELRILAVPEPTAILSATAALAAILVTTRRPPCKRKSANPRR